MKIKGSSLPGKLAGLVRLGVVRQAHHERVFGQAQDEPGSGIIRRSNRAAAADLDPLGPAFGAGGGWANPEYGAYYATSVSVYAAVKLRADAVSRPPVTVYRRSPEGTKMPVAPSHPVQHCSTGSTTGTPGATCGGPPRFT